MEKERIITIVSTKNAELGLFNDEEIGKYEVLNKDDLIERLKELTDDGFGYTVLISTK